MFPIMPGIIMPDIMPDIIGIIIPMQPGIPPIMPCIMPFIGVSSSESSSSSPDSSPFPGAVAGAADADLALGAGAAARSTPGGGMGPTRPKALPVRSGVLERFSACSQVWTYASMSFLDFSFSTKRPHKSKTKQSLSVMKDSRSSPPMRLSTSLPS